jgi:hypothetical protein
MPNNINDNIFTRSLDAEKHRRAFHDTITAFWFNLKNAVRWSLWGVKEINEWIVKTIIHLIIWVIKSIWRESKDGITYIWNNRKLYKVRIQFYWFIVKESVKFVYVQLRLLLRMADCLITYTLKTAINLWRGHPNDGSI